MITRHHSQSSNSGFTLIEVMSVVAIIGLLASVALPALSNYAVRAKVSEGVLILSGLRKRVELEFNLNGTLGIDLPYSPPPDGQLAGSPIYDYSTLFGSTDEMWETIQYKTHGSHRVLVLKAYEKAEWGYSDIGLKLQIRHRDDDTLDFRCVVGENEVRLRYAPSSCSDGIGLDWTSW
jgi:prepilin-type N-terminal cleavage/methylation domain-containing protein